MADTTSTVLGIVDQETGGNTNTWGDIADANFAKLEKAIATTVLVAATGGTDTLSDDDERGQHIVVSGTLASNSELVMSLVKSIIVSNTTTGGSYTVTVKTAAGSGVVVPRGETMIVRNDGTNVVEVPVFDRDHIVENLYRYAGSAGGTADAITATLAMYLGSSNVEGMSVSCTLAATNTATSVTFNLNGIGAATVLRRDGAAPAIGELLINTVRTFTFDGTNWIISGGVIANDSVSTAKIIDDAVTTAKIVNDAVTTAKIVNSAVTLAKLANIATARFIGRTTAGTGVPEALTGTQATALLNAFVGDSGSGGTKGLVPAPAANDADEGKLKFLGAGGSWFRPAWHFIEEIVAGGSDQAMTSAAIDAAYEWIRITFEGVPDAADRLQLNVATTGPAWLSNKYGYYGNWHYYNFNTGSAGGSPGVSNTITVGDGIELVGAGYDVASSTSDPGIQGQILINNFNSTSRRRMVSVPYCDCKIDGAQAQLGIQDFGGVIETTARLTHARLIWDTGTTDWRSGSRMIIEGRA
ncbi:MAG: hypothetical protein GY952_14180 [Rhodobacteraceae bacterium]|nr:hypothetical protein [Paracoccaceae bacterium]